MQLGRYQILKQLATGDVANVLLARASGLEGFARHVVIKCIRRELAREERLVESFLEEARIAAALHHQNIVQVHDIGEQDGSYFFAMEYVHGEDVSKLLAKVRERGELVPLEHVVAIIAATAAGLHHAHDQRSPAGEPLGLVHLDVCPQNILLGYDGSVKLVDFGMAKAARRSTKTAAGALKGKASYMSPEQCTAQTIDRRTDTFALGIVLYELMTAQRLFKGANEFFTMAAIVEGTIPPPSATRPDVPKALDDIVLRALARAPEARYQTVEDLREALERFAIEHELRASNKAFADYMTKLFGQRPEPWHTDEEPPAPTKDFDSTAAQGLVATPQNQGEIIARHGPSSTAPIMMAHSIAEVEAETAAAEAARSEIDEGWGDEEPPTTTLLPEDLPIVVPSAAAPPAAAPPAAAPPVLAQPTAAQPTDAPPTDAPPTDAPPTDTPPTDAPQNASTELAPATVAPPEVAPQAVLPPVVPPAVPPAATAQAVPRDSDAEETRNERPPAAAAGVDEDPFGATLIAPPLFVDDVPVDEPVEEPVATPERRPVKAALDDDAVTIDGNAPAPQTPVYDDDEPPPLDTPSYIGPPINVLDEPPRAMSEHMYIGPPAPPAGRFGVARRFFSMHRRPILIGAAASVVVLTLSLLVLR